jgi:hypothetical protein
MKELKNNDNSAAGKIRHSGKIQEKLRIAQRMIKRHAYPKEIAYVVELPLVVIEKIKENPEKCDDLIELVGSTVTKVSSTKDIAHILEEFLLENDETIKIREKIKTVLHNMVKEGQREAKLRAAYRMIKPYVCLDNIADLTGLEFREVECLLEIARIRKEERERNSKQIAKRLLQEQLKPERIYQLTDLSLDEVLELQDQYTGSFDEEDEELEDEALYDFDYSFLKIGM